MYESLTGKIVQSLYPAIYNPDGSLVVDFTADDKSRLVPGAKDYEVCEEVYARTRDNKIHLVSDTVFTVVGGELLLVEE